MKLCQDPVVKRLRQIFEANILKVPEERFQPLVALLRIEGKNNFWTQLPAMVDGDILEMYSTISKSQMADLSGKISKSTDIEVGLEILEGFLKGIGLPSASITAQFAGATKVAFSFKNVVRQYFEPGILVDFLNGTPLDTDRSDTQQIINGEAELFVIDSIITSTDFSIHITDTKDGAVHLDIPVIENLVANSNTDIKVKKESETSITFEGNKALTFAFTCLICEVDKAGRITLRPKVLPKGVFHGTEVELEHQLLTEEAEMMDF